MPDSYLIDGYNLLHALGMVQRDMPPGGLEEARRRLLDFLARAFGPETVVTIVFDARHAPRHLGRRQVHEGLQVEFAPAGKSADDRIEELIELAAVPDAMVVISEDHRLRDAARRRGARDWSHQDLLDFLDKKSQGSAPADCINADDRAAVPLSSEELRRWMREFGHLQDDPELKEFFDLDRFE